MLDLSCYFCRGTTGVDDSLTEPWLIDVWSKSSKLFKIWAIPFKINYHFFVKLKLHHDLTILWAMTWPAILRGKCSRCNLPCKIIILLAYVAFACDETTSHHEVLEQQIWVSFFFAHKNHAKHTFKWPSLAYPTNERHRSSSHRFLQIQGAVGQLAGQSTMSTCKPEAQLTWPAAKL